MMVIIVVVVIVMFFNGNDGDNGDVSDDVCKFQGDRN